MAKIDYTDFSSLIEIGLKLNEHIEANQKYPNQNSRKRIYYWNTILKVWLKRNYEKNGIKEHHVKEFETIKTNNNGKTKKH